jgi:hypothetical protein
MISTCRNFKRQGLSKNKIELIRESESEVTDESSDETHGEENNVTEQAPALPHQGVYTRIL